MSELPLVVIDTNVFVAAGFCPGSSAARVVDEVRARRLQLIWNDATRRETEHILNKIPRLSWASVAELFLNANCHGDAIDPARFEIISDPDDRKFAALAEATGAVLLTNDRDLLGHRDILPLPIMTPHEFCHQKPPTKVGGT